MSPTKSKRGTGPGRTGATVRRGWKWAARRRAPLGLALCLMAGAAAAPWLWSRLRPHVAAQPEYLVEAQEIIITKLPPWIRADIVGEVARDAGLAPRLSILDEQLGETLRRAFALHPWVAKVGEVHTAYPASIQIELEYRRPVAMVVVSDGLLPIDGAGILLPTADFSPEAAQRYPRIEGIASMPLKSVGTSWGDPSVEAAAKLASFLTGAGDILERPTIRLVDAGSALRPPRFALKTASGAEFAWGAAPGSEVDDEPQADEKLSRLRQFVTVHSRVDQTPAAQRDLHSK